MKKSLLKRTGPPAGILAHIQFEIYPAKGALRKIVNSLPPETSISVSCSPTGGIEPTLELHKRLTEKGYKSTPHISARVIKSREHLREVLDKLAESGTKEIMALGGDSEPPRGPIASSAQLLREMDDLGTRFDSVAIAGYPQGHHLISDEALSQALLDKQAFASHIITQICFDADHTIDWVGNIRRAGIELPIYVGVPGKLNAVRLLDFAVKSGVGDARRFLKSHFGILGHLLRPIYSPDKLISKLMAGSEKTGLELSGLHVFTFNQVKRSREWAEPLLTRQSHAD